LGENMPVRCRGHILRVARPTPASESSQDAPKIGVAVRFDGYEYLPETSNASATFPRISALHPQSAEEQPAAHSTARPVLG
jgi:hypothetical protein